MPLNDDPPPEFGTCAACQRPCCNCAVCVERKGQRDLCYSCYHWNLNPGILQAEIQ
jgi:hypothetical protein